MYAEFANQQFTAILDRSPSAYQEFNRPAPGTIARVIPNADYLLNYVRQSFLQEHQSQW